MVNAAARYKNITLPFIFFHSYSVSFELDIQTAIPTTHCFCPSIYLLSRETFLYTKYLYDIFTPEVEKINIIPIVYIKIQEQIAILLTLYYIMT